MQRCSLSVPSNIAEGKGRLSARELRQYLGIARGSLFELLTQAEIALRLGLLDQDAYDVLDHQAALIGTGINRFLARLK